MRNIFLQPFKTDFEYWIFLKVLQSNHLPLKLEKNTVRSSHKEKKIPTQVSSWEYCEIFKNNLFHRAPPVGTTVWNLGEFTK